MMHTCRYLFQYLRMFEGLGCWDVGMFEGLQARARLCSHKLFSLNETSTMLLMSFDCLCILTGWFI